MTRRRLTNEQFLDRANKVHGGKYEYLSPYVSAKSKVKIRCPEHGIFEQQAFLHLSGYGCPRCAHKYVNSKNTKSNEWFLEQAHKIHGDRYSYPEEYTGMKVPIDIICQVHGHFLQKPKAHLGGSGCQKCARDVLRYSFDKFVDTANEVHHSKYTYASEYVNSDTKITISCPIHGDFEQKPSAHLYGQGCPKCGNVKKGDGTRLSYDQFVVKSKSVYGDKYQYPDHNYINSWTPITIECSVHGLFEQSPQNNINGHGCQQCVFDANRKSSAQFIVEANIVHDSCYQYYNDYIDCKTPITIGCPIHGDFAQYPRHHLAGAGCPRCSPNAKLDKGKFVEMADIVHNNKYSYPGDYINCRTKMEICCPIHGSFMQRPTNHLCGYGCQKCALSFVVSSQETAWLDSFNIPQEYRNKSLHIGNRTVIPDAYDPATNTIYEFYGDYWHGNPYRFQPDKINKFANKTFGELYRHTMDREALIKQAGYKIISIWESDFKKVAKPKG